MIWNCRENKKTMSLKHESWRYLERFGTEEKPVDLVKYMTHIYIYAQNNDTEKDVCS